VFIIIQQKKAISWDLPNEYEFPQDYCRCLLYQIKKIWDINIYNIYFAKIILPMATKLAEGYVFSNYNSLFSGNRSKKTLFLNPHSLRYFKLHVYFEILFGFLNYKMKLMLLKWALLSSSGASKRHHRLILILILLMKLFLDVLITDVHLLNIIKLLLVWTWIG
jgi:hypothetical protein